MEIKIRQENKDDYDIVYQAVKDAFGHAHYYPRFGYLPASRFGIG